MTYYYGDDSARFPEGARWSFRKSDGSTVSEHRKQETTPVSLPEPLD